MRLEDYPRPDDDTGVGFHYSLSPSHLAVEAGRYWLPVLEGLGARWLIVRLSNARDVPTSLFATFTRAGLEIVVVLDPPQIGMLKRADVEDAAAACAKVGVRYMAVYDRPNSIDQWVVSEWFRPKPARQFVEKLLPCLQAVADKGLVPVLPALDARGDYWDLGFLSETLKMIAGSPYSPLLEKVAIGIRNFAHNRPLAWGKGGKTRWPQAGPYLRPPDSQDHVGFWLFEWYDEVVREVVGQTLPMVAVANGVVVGEDHDPDYPAVDELTHSIRSVEMARTLMEGELPSYVLNQAFWVLHGDDAGGKRSADWFRPDGSELPAVSALKLMKKSPRPILSSGGGVAVTKVRRPIYHYLLFYNPPIQPIRSGWERPALIEAVTGYVDRFQPTVGFTVEEAKRASRVTLIGGDLQVGATLEGELKATGCLVERIEATTARDVKRVFDELARRGQRFYYLPE